MIKYSLLTALVVNLVQAHYSPKDDTFDVFLENPEL